MMSSSLPLRILVVDDQPARVGCLDALLRPENGIGSVELARDGAEAITALQAGTPDLLLMGTAMARMDGLTTLRFLQRSFSVPVVVLAEAPEVEDVLDALSLGAVGYLCLEDAWLPEPGQLASYLDRLRRRTARVTCVPFGLDTTIISTTLVTVPRGEVTALGATLRSGGIPMTSALYVLIDGPPWLIEPLARRLHRNTPWRVLPAVPGDPLTPGHALLASVHDQLTVFPANGRARVARGPIRCDVHDVMGRRAGTTARPAPSPAPAPGSRR